MTLKIVKIHGFENPWTESNAFREPECSGVRRRELFRDLHMLLLPVRRASLTPPDARGKSHQIAQIYPLFKPELMSFSRGSRGARYFAYRAVLTDQRMLL